MNNDINETARAPQTLTLHELVRLFRHQALPIAVMAALGVVGALALLAFKRPVFRATASLVLDDDRSSGGILSDLAMLARPPMAISEIEVLRSRAIAEKALEPAPDARLASDENPLQVRNLGLTTLVDDEGRAPLAGVWPGTRRAPPADLDDSRLFAFVDHADVDAPETLRVEILDGGRARLSVADFGAALRSKTPAPLEIELASGARSAQAVEFAGIRIRLEARGTLAGRSFLVKHVERAEALERLLEATHASETARNSGVIELSIDDSDPFRAAETANALCVNYLDRNVKRGERKASRTLEFIAGQLSGQLESLDTAEREVVALQKDSPHTIDIGESAKALIEQLKDLEVEKIQLELSRMALSEAVSLLETGRVDGLARLSIELADPVSSAYVEQIATLQAESVLQERSNTGAFKTLLQSKEAELRLESDALEIEIAGVRSALQGIQAGDDGACARLASVDARGRGGDPLSSTYATQLAGESAHLAQLEKEFTPEHPEVLVTRRKVADLRARLLEIGKSRLTGLEAQKEEFERLLVSYEDRMHGLPSSERAKIAEALSALMTRTREHLHSRAAGVAARQDDVSAQLAELEARLGELPEAERALASPKRRLAAHAEIVKFLLARQQEAEITRASTVASAEFIDTAQPPRRRHGPSLPLYLIGGLLVGLVLGFTLAFVRQSIDSGIMSSAELESASGLPVFGAIPDFRGGRYRVDTAGEHFLALRDDPDGAIAEAYRSLRASLKFVLSANTELRVLAFTSSSQGEGKSVTNIDIALAFALGEKRVLLVDADMRRPVVQHYFGLPLGPGLSEILKGKAPWSECVHKTEFENLHVITAGKQPTSPGDLLQSSACEVLIRELRTSYDLVVFDVPPALAVADTEGFASKLDALILLVRSRKLTRAVVARTADCLRSAGANLIGAVLNADRPTRTESRYGYGYGYGYDAGTARKTREPEPEPSASDD